MLRPMRVQIGYIGLVHERVAVTTASGLEVRGAHHRKPRRLGQPMQVIRGAGSLGQP